MAPGHTAATVSHDQGAQEEEENRRRKTAIPGCRRSWIGAERSFILSEHKVVLTIWAWSRTLALCLVGSRTRGGHMHQSALQLGWYRRRIASAETPWLTCTVYRAGGGCADHIEPATQDRTGQGCLGSRAGNVLPNRGHRTRTEHSVTSSAQKVFGDLGLLMPRRIQTNNRCPTGGKDRKFA
ncbi:hypothetical protein N657DRAFT_268489 [Parathielavia appendiculata]|uniref:Uncharacterized protein n=1 Tax=Parathielavia appendiculata TaxID=2587402 RepID=A0AAN6Z5M5_9PEZI|nr:hypothetical protein N657DRAFT_268489 [Parathielavia appendiculata]